MLRASFRTPQGACTSGVICWRRLRQWEDLGVWAAAHQVVLNWLGDLDVIDWSRASIDSLSIRAKRGVADRTQAAVVALRHGLVD